MNHFLHNRRRKYIIKKPQSLVNGQLIKVLYYLSGVLKYKRNVLLGGFIFNVVIKK